MAWRRSNTRSVTFSIPDSINRDAIIQLLHNHHSFMQLNPTFTDVTHVETDPAIYEHEWFQNPSSGTPIETYMISSEITVMPGIGARGKKRIQFPTSLRNIDSGVRTRADSPFDITVGSHWTVQPDTSSSREWVLVVERTVECAWWLLPFVTHTYDGVNANIGRDLLQRVERNGS